MNFRSPIIELNGRIEYLINWNRKGHIYVLKGVHGWKHLSFSTYFFAGAAGFWFDPYGKYEGKWYRLKPLCTEGQGLLPTRKKYSSIQVAIPFGIGLRYKLGRNSMWSMGIEYGVRWTFTDYLDDVSTTYIDPDLLAAYKGELAVELSNPGHSSDPSDPLYSSTRAGQQRGDPRDKDTYMFAVISLYYNLEHNYAPKLRFY